MKKQEINNLFIKALLFSINKKILTFNSNYIIEKKIKNNKYLTKKNYKTLSKASLPLYFKNLKKNNFLLQITNIKSIATVNSKINYIFNDKKNFFGLKNSIPLLIKYNNNLFYSLHDFNQLIHFFNLFSLFLTLNYIIRILIINNKLLLKIVQSTVILQLVVNHYTSFKK